MVVDQLSNAPLYEGVGERIAQALAWVGAQDLAALSLGRHEIQGADLFALVSEYATKLPDAGKWEAHRKYLDLQVVVSGVEAIGWAPLSTLSGGDYIPEKDIVWLTGQGSLVRMEAGSFMLLWPEDGHMPGMAVGTPETVRKVVVKIAV